MSDELNWSDVAGKEEITEDDIKNAGSSGSVRAGKYVCIVESSTPRQVNPEAKASYYAANLKLKVEDVVELDGKPVNGEEGDQFIGRIIWDSVSLATEGENDFIRNRRICIVKRAGIISENSTQIPSDTWSKRIIGIRFLIEVIDNEYIKKDGTKVKNTKVAMFGYEAPEAAKKVSANEIDDI